MVFVAEVDVETGVIKHLGITGIISRIEDNHERFGRHTVDGQIHFAVVSVFRTCAVSNRYNAYQKDRDENPSANFI